MRDEYQIRIWDGELDGEVFPKVIRCTDVKELTIVDQQWRGQIQSIQTDLLNIGRPDVKIEFNHWLWQRKWTDFRSRTADSDFYRVIYNERIAGMLIVTRNQPSRKAETCSNNLLYIEYLAASPENVYSLCLVRGIPGRLSGIGFALIRLSLEISIELHCCGKIGLHSLPGADNFYRKLGMKDYGKDDKYGDLAYFEMSSEDAKSFLERRI